VADIQVWPASVLDDIEATAASCARRRAHVNLHARLEDPVQRFFMAFAESTYVQPHKHREAHRWECVFWLAGRGAMLIFDEDGRIEQRLELGERAARAIEVPPGVWHTLVSLAPMSHFLEVKPGPYVASADKAFAAWAPAEGEAEAGAFLSRLKNLAVGEAAVASKEVLR
jgi:cupin fold WbuC family metalloprotein